MSKAPARRGYSDEFPSDQKPRTRYLLDFIPPKLWASVRKAATEDGISLRTLILRLLSQWLERRHKRPRKGTNDQGQRRSDRPPNR